MRLRRLWAWIGAVWLLACACADAGEAAVRWDRGLTAGVPEVIRTVHVPALPAAMSAWGTVQAVAQEDVRAWEWEVRLAELERTHGPETFYGHWQRTSDTERSTRDVLAGSVMLRDRWRLSAVAERSAWHLNQEELATESAWLSSLMLRLLHEPSERSQWWAALMPYTGSDGRGVGVAAGATWQPHPDWYVQAQAEAGMPWQDSTLALSADGRQHRLSTSASWSVWPRILLSGQIERSWYAAQGDEGTVGYSDLYGARLDVTVWERPGRTVTQGFLDPTQTYDDALATRVRVYGAFSHEQYDLASAFTAVPVTDSSKDFRTGLLAEWAPTARWGIGVDAFLGQDHDRGVAWNRLYGIDTRLQIVPTGRVRGWIRYTMTSSSGSAVAGGREETLGAGLNMNW